MPNEENMGIVEEQQEPVEKLEELNEQEGGLEQQEPKTEEAEDSQESQEEDIKLTFTPEELEKEVNRRKDKAITKALKTQKEKLLREQRKKEQEEKLKAENKYKELYEFQKAELEKEKRELELERKKTKAQSLLIEKGLDSNLIDYLNINEETDIETIVEDFSKALEGLLNKKVEQVAKNSQKSIGKRQVKTNTPEEKEKLILEQVKKITGAGTKYTQKENPYFKN